MDLGCFLGKTAAAAIDSESGNSAAFVIVLHQAGERSPEFHGLPAVGLLAAFLRDEIRRSNDRPIVLDPLVRNQLRRDCHPPPPAPSEGKGSDVSSASSTNASAGPTKGRSLTDRPSA